MTKFMKESIEKGDFDYGRETLFLRVIQLLKPYGKDIFRKGGGFSTGLFEAITIGFATYIDYYEGEGASKVPVRIDELKNDSDFSQFTGSQSNSKTRIINRLKIAEKVFKPR